MPRLPLSLGEIIISDIVFKVKKYNPNISREEIITFFGLTADVIPLCSYCNKVLVHKSQTCHPYKDVPSIDHRKPHYITGDNSLNNLALVCHECNILKSTLDDITYRQLYVVLNKPENKILKENYFNQMWRGKIANKVDRVNNDDRLPDFLPRWVHHYFT